MDTNLIASLADFASGLVSWVWSPVLFFLLLGCGLIFSVASKFVQWRVLTHGYACIRGDYDNPDDAGQINHFQALCAALSATIGLGNIAGVAVAVSVGGPGAVFWMWVVGFFGMALKFMECTLAVMFRDTSDSPDPGEVVHDTEPTDHGHGEVRGGPMWYIQRALVEPLRAKGNAAWVVFRLLAVLFAVATVLNSFGGGNMFQGWNVANVLKESFKIPEIASATVVSVLVALVIIGGIKRIGHVASTLVPGMCVLYVGGALFVILMHLGELPACIALIVKSAFTPAAEGGAFAGVTVWMAFTWGLRRACFSNEAGEGSAAMAHAAARTDEPVREGVVAGIGPFIDTLLICTMTALVLLMTGIWNRPAVGSITAIEGDTVVVACNPDLPKRLGEMYYDSISADAAINVAIYVDQTQGNEPNAISLPVARPEAKGEGGWETLTTLKLNIQDVAPERREQIAIGQPVHLDIAGAKLTAFAFDETMSGFGTYIVTLGVCLFAFSTMISWSYYGEKGAEYLLGPRAILPYKFIFVLFVFLGMVLDKFSTVYDISDATSGMMVLCNLPAVLILSPVVLRAARDYFGRLDRGEMPKDR